MPNENIKKNQTISGRKVVWAVLSAMVVGAVGGVFGAVRVLNTDHFTVLSNTARLQAVEEDCVKKETWQIQYQYIADKLVSIENKLDKLK